MQPCTGDYGKNNQKTCVKLISVLNDIHHLGDAHPDQGGGEGGEDQPTRRRKRVSGALRMSVRRVNKPEAKLIEQKMHKNSNSHTPNCPCALCTVRRSQVVPGRTVGAWFARAMHIGKLTRRIRRIVGKVHVQQRIMLVLLIDFCGA